MTDETTEMTPADWARLEAALRQAFADQEPPGSATTGIPGAGAADAQRLLHHAYLLLLDGRADVTSLHELASRAAYLSWASLVHQTDGTTAGVAAVLAGWETAGLKVAGRTAVYAGDGAVVAPARRPLGPAEVLAVWHAAAGARAGIGATELGRMAAGGVLTPDNAPEPP